LVYPFSWLSCRDLDSKKNERMFKLTKKIEEDIEKDFKSVIDKAFKDNEIGQEKYLELILLNRIAKYLYELAHKY